VARQDACKDSAPFVRRPRQLIAVQGLLVLAAVFWLVVGVSALWHHYRDGEPRAFRAASGALMIGLGLVQLRIVRETWRAGHFAQWATYRGVAVWRCLLVALVACYVAGLVLGPNPHVRYFFRAALALCHTAALVPLLAGPRANAWWEAARRRPMIRHGGRLVFTISLLFVMAEGSLHMADFVADVRLPMDYSARRLRLAPGLALNGVTVNACGYWDEEFEPRPVDGVLRVAVLGDEVTLSGTAETNCLAQLEQRLPGVEVYNFGMPQAGPREYAAQVAGDVARFDPHLVLAFVSVGDDIVEQAPLPGSFDWRGLRLYQLSYWALGEPDGDSSDGPTIRRSTSYEAYLNQCAAQATVCRTPIDESMEQKWRESLRHLDVMLRQCRQRGIPLALVITPTEFQVNMTLCETLRRRAGWEAGNVDLELPQRRLKRFADKCEIPVVDLLPEFRDCESSPFVRYGHDWSDAGNRAAAEAIGRWMGARYQPQWVAQADRERL